MINLTVCLVCQRNMEELGAGEALGCCKQSLTGHSSGSMEDKMWREIRPAEARFMRSQRGNTTLNSVSQKKDGVLSPGGLEGVRV